MSVERRRLDDEVRRAGFGGYEDCPWVEADGPGACPRPFLCSEKGDCALFGNEPAAGRGGPQQ